MPIARVFGSKVYSYDFFLESSSYREKISKNSKKISLDNFFWIFQNIENLSDFEINFQYFGNFRKKCQRWSHIGKKGQKIEKNYALIIFLNFPKYWNFLGFWKCIFFLKFPKYWKLISKIREIFNILKNSRKIIKAYFFLIFLTFFSTPKIRQRHVALCEKVKLTSKIRGLRHSNPVQTLLSCGVRRCT